MHFAVISDLHFGIKQNSDVFLKSQINYLLDEFIPALEREGIDHLVIAGDVFDSETAINIKVGNRVFEFFDALQSHGIAVIVIVGNHDIYLKSSLEYTSLKFLRGYSNVTLVDTVMFNAYTGVLCVPWIIDGNAFVSELDKHKARVCIGHFDIAGFAMQKNTASVTGLSPALFNRFELTVSGHFHIRSIAGNVIYIGSPYQLNRGDAGDERGFMLVDVGDEIKYTFINSISPIKFIKINYPDAYTPGLIKNNIVDILVQYDDKFDGIKLEEYIKEMETYCPAMPPTVQVLSRAGVDINTEIGKIDFVSTKEIMHEYVDKKYSADKDELKKVLDGLYAGVTE